MVQAVRARHQSYGAALPRDARSATGGGAGHGFSYHHIITRDAGTNISDACLWVDEDGDPNHLPGTPGYNHDRDWDDYEKLLAKANVNWNLDPLPQIK